MRLFVAVDFDNGTKETILNIQKELKRFCTKGRWKYWDNFHLTLKFLGEVSENKIGELEEAINKAVEKADKFTISLNNLGLFGQGNPIRVVWLGVEGEIAKLKSLQRLIEDETWAVGFQKEKRSYSPHVTIAQDVLLNNAFDDVKKNIQQQFGEMLINKVALMKSEQIGNKRVYTTIKEFYIGG